LDGFRTSSTFPQQDRDKLLNITSSLTSFFDYTGITNLAQSKIASRISKLVTKDNHSKWGLFFRRIKYVKSTTFCIKSNVNWIYW